MPEDFPLPPPPPMNAERAEKISKRRGGRKPKHASPRPVDLAHLPPADPEPIQRPLIDEDGNFDTHQLLTLFIANVPRQVIIDHFGVDPDKVDSILKKVANDTLIAAEQLLEQLTLKNIATIEHLKTVWVPLAMDGHEKAHKAVIDEIRLQQELLRLARQEIVDRQQRNHADGGDIANAAMTLEDIESTFTRENELYQLAQSLEGSDGEVLTKLLADFNPTDAPPEHFDLPEPGDDDDR